MGGKKSTPKLVPKNNYGIKCLDSFLLKKNMNIEWTFPFIHLELVIAI